MKSIIITIIVFTGSSCLGQVKDRIPQIKKTDHVKLHTLTKIAISALRISEIILRSPVRFDHLKSTDL